MALQVSPDLGLVQSSTAADQIPFKFDKSQEHMVAGSYIEFAQRAVLPEFQHFKVNSASFSVTRLSAAMLQLTLAQRPISWFYACNKDCWYVVLQWWRVKGFPVSL